MTVSYEYDSKGNVSKEIYEDGSYQTFTYNDLDYEISRTTYKADKTPEKTVKTYYDKDYNVEKEVDIKGGENGT
ncbi:MAG: hypothetical protein K6G65_02445, partial [Lachnospiraceae bacterium]|nr:hypothetical protein [Lachnospiraceae bacterium]